MRFELGTGMAHVCKLGLFFWVLIGFSAQAAAPTITPSAKQVVNLSNFLINGTGFDPNAINNVVTFNSGAIGIHIPPPAKLLPPGSA